MLKSVQRPNSLALIHNFLELASDIDTRHLSSHQYIKDMRAFLREIIKTDYDTNLSLTRSNVTTSEKLSINRLFNEIIGSARELDELLCQASLQAVLNFQVSSRLSMRLGNKISCIESASTHLQKYLIDTEN